MRRSRFSSYPSSPLLSLGSSRQGERASLYGMSVAKFTLDVQLNIAKPLTADRLFLMARKTDGGHPQVPDVGKHLNESTMAGSGSPGN